MKNNQNHQIIELKLEIDHIKEYLQTEVCKKCEEMFLKLNECEILLQKILQEQ
jgi:hypothetical protein